MGMDMRLTNLVLAYFMRTKFMDIGKIGTFIETNVSPFLSEKGQKKINVNPVLPIDEIPRMQIHSTNEEYLINLYENRIDLVRMGLYDASVYNDVIDEFITIGKELLPIIESDENICGRLGLVNDTFFITDDPINTIIARYFKNNISSHLSRLNLNYTESIDIDNYLVNNITIVQQRELNMNKIYPGVLVRRDVNIDKIQKKIDAMQVSSFLDRAVVYINKENMEAVLYAK